METLTGIPEMILKRSGQAEAYDKAKIREAIRKSFQATQAPVSDEQLNRLVQRAEELIGLGLASDHSFSVEYVQDQVEQALMEADFFPQAKA